MGIAEAIAGVGKAVSSFYDWATGRSKLNNTPEMQEAAKAAKRTETNNQISGEVQSDDTTDISNRVSP